MTSILSETLNLVFFYLRNLLYLILSIHYGAPNSFVNIPGGDPDAPIKWGYTVCLASGIHIEILRKSTRIEIAQIGTKVKEERIINFLLQEIIDREDEINTVLKRFESYSLIVNPYYKYAQMEKSL